MRLPKAKHKRITSALFVFLIALISVQCIFVVESTAFAESRPYDTLISDYFSFSAPTHVAAGDGVVAVFDAGDVVIFREGGYTVFSSGVEECDKLCVSEQGIFLLSGVSVEEETTPEIHAFDLSGQAKEIAFPTEGVTDIALSGSTLYTLSSVTNLKGYSTENGREIASYTPGKVYLFHLAVQEEEIYLINLLGRVFRKTGAEFLATEGRLDGDEEHFVLHGEDLFYAKNGNVCLYGEGVFLEKGKGSGDALFSRATDFAAADGLLYVLDGDNLAVKTYDLETKAYRGMIGACGKDLGRLNAPVALDVAGGKILVADSQRASVFTDAGVRALNGRAVVAPTDAVFAGGSVFLADDGVLREYNSAFVYTKDHALGEGECLFVTAAPDGTVYASSGKEVYCKKADESFFEKLLTEEKKVTGLHVGIGGQVLYVLSGDSLCAYSPEGDCLRTLTPSEKVTSFAVDYRGNVFFLAESKVLRYTRTPEGYVFSVSYALPESYERFADFALDEEGRAYLIADHNVLIYPKSAFGAFVAGDSDFKDEVPAASPRFVCEITEDRAIAYASPDNFEDISTLIRGTKLMCYATVPYDGNEYLRVETEKGAAYVAGSDVKIYEEGSAPFERARCLIAAIGPKKVGVNLYSEPSYIAIEAGVEPLFKGLGREEVFEVKSLVAAEEGEDVWGFYRVEYMGETAYVLTTEIVSVDDDPIPMPTTYRAKVKSGGLGKTVAVYREASRDSEVIARLTDGSEIKTLEKIDKNNEFTAVLYNGEVCYVLSENLGEGGLSGGQILAIVLSVAAAIGSVLTILILRANKKRKRYHKE